MQVGIWGGERLFLGEDISVVRVMIKSGEKIGGGASRSSGPLTASTVQEVLRHPGAHSVDPTQSQGHLAPLFLQHQEKNTNVRLTCR